MVIILIIIALVFYFFINAHLADLGAPMRSRGSLRYQRRKARRLGVDPASLEIRPQEQNYQPTSQNGKIHTRKFMLDLFIALSCLILMFGGEVVLMRIGASGNWGVIWLFVTGFGPLFIKIINHLDREK